MIKVLSIVSYKILPYSSGGQKSIAQFNHFLAQQCSLYAVSTNNKIELATNYTMLNWLPNSPLKFMSIAAVVKMKRLIDKEKITHIIIEHPYLGWMGILLRKLCKIPLIIHTHNIEFERFKSVNKWWWPILKLYEQWVLKNANFVFCISEEDRQYMLQHMHVNAENTAVITFGVPQHIKPNNKKNATSVICKELNISVSTRIILFNGLLSYAPNSVAVENIIHHILPLLQKKMSNNFLIVICGKGLSESLQQQISQMQNIVYKGFVSDIELYFTGADVFINPILSGGGIKTKLVEALGFNTTVVSTKTGALGFKEEVALKKLFVVDDNNWTMFVEAIYSQLYERNEIDEDYYKEYYWGNIAAKATSILQQLKK